MSKLRVTGTSLATLTLAICLPVMAGAEDDRAPAPEEPQYPIAVAVSGDDVYSVDLDGSGVWKSSVGGDRSWFYAGSRFLRQEMNRPRPIVAHPDGGVIVGDSASREIYHIAADGSSARPLNDGFLGIPMALAVSPDKTQLYIGDAERRATFRIPINGVEKDEDGKFAVPELVARVNARGLDFADDATLYAATPDADAVVRIDVTTGETTPEGGGTEATVTPVVTDRPFQYVGGMVWTGDHGYVSDVYAKTIWKFDADGNVEPFFEGDPLKGPVLMDHDDEHLYVAEPKNKTVYRIHRETKAIEPAL